MYRLQQLETSMCKEKQPKPHVVAIWLLLSLMAERPTRIRCDSLAH